MRSTRYGAVISTFWTLIAQGFNLIAMLAPLVLGKLSNVAVLVFIGAIAVIVTYTFTFSFPSLFPSIVGRRERVISFSASLLGICVAAAVIGAIAIVGVISGASWAPTLYWVAVLSFCQGVYVIAVTVLIRGGDHRRFALTRIAYSIFNVTSAILASLFVASEFGLTAAVAASFAFGALVAALGRIADFLRIVRRQFPQPRELWRYVRLNWAATISALFTVLAFQTSSLATGFLGGYAGVWAGVVRVSGGFAGISQQVISPIYDMRFSRAVRVGDPEFRRISISSLGLGLALAAASYVGVIVTFYLNTRAQGSVNPLHQGPEIYFISAAYTVGALFPSVAGKFVVMLGHQKAYFIWVLGKLLLTASALLFLRNLELITSLALLELLAAVSYAILLFVCVGGRKKAAGSQPALAVLEN